MDKDLKPSGQVVLSRLETSYERRALRVLHMVHELHKAGYQRLRICPGTNDSGTAWRCGVTPATNVYRNNGAMCVDWGLQDMVVTYTTASENRYFDWVDATKDTARQLAAKFLERFTPMVSQGVGSDWNYAGWYVEMLGRAERGEFPLAYDNYLGDMKPRRGFLPTTARRFNSSLPMPPGGLSERLCDFSYC